MADDGSGTATLANAAKRSMDYDVNFCTFSTGECMIQVTHVSVDANGNGSATFQFPQKGTFAGVFRVMSADDTITLFSAMVSGAGAASQTFHLVRSADVMPHPSPWAPLGSDPLSSGVITIDGSAATPTGQLELHGAAANMEYGIVECDATPDHTPLCTSVMGSFFTDATGSATVTFTPANTNPAIYEVKHGDLHEFVTGFAVN